MCRIYIQQLNACELVSTFKLFNQFLPHSRHGHSNIRRKFDCCFIRRTPHVPNRMHNFCLNYFILCFTHNSTFLPKYHARVGRTKWRNQMRCESRSVFLSSNTRLTCAFPFCMKCSVSKMRSGHTCDVLGLK